MTAEGASAIAAPRPILASQDCSSFSCGEPALDSWLKQRALRSQRDGGARSYVACRGQTVVGYNSLAVGSIARDLATGKVRHNMPDPVPVMLLARLAVSHDCQGLGLGASLLQDAVMRTLAAAELAGIRAMALHAISHEAKRFYHYFGFQASPSQPMTLMATLADLRLASSQDRL